MARVKSKRVRKRVKLTAEQRAVRNARAKKARMERKFRAAVRQIFTQSGFQHFPSEGTEFKFKPSDAERTLELDAVYVLENVIVVVEDTCSQDAKDHLAKKLIGFDLINAHPAHFVEALVENIQQFAEYFKTSKYQPRDFVVRTTYFSMHALNKEHIDNAARHHVPVVLRPLANYFNALVKTISKSAQFEILKFLDVGFSAFANVAGGSVRGSNSYKGFLLPEPNSSYPDGYKIVSFYVDPESLLRKSYVLRKSGWLNPNLSYQRLLDLKKIRSMRKYLTDTKRVYVGNIIATLPSTTKIVDEQTQDQLGPEDQMEVRHVEVVIPDEYDVIGLIDGQHRVYSYHEGSDIYDAEIAKMRGRQNLLVTGIIHPREETELKRARFEARVFLEINTQQTKVKSVLTQEIELIVSPYSPTAIARRVLTKLGENGALKDRLEEHIFDDSVKLKVASIVSYGLKPLCKRDGTDSLFSAWCSLKGLSPRGFEFSDQSVEEYTGFCYDEINCLLGALKKSFPDGWHIGHERKMLTPTSVNGFLKCLRLILENGLERSFGSYESRLADIKSFPFGDFKSSQWNRLGIRLFELYFSDVPTKVEDL